MPIRRLSLALIVLLLLSLSLLSCGAEVEDATATPLRTAASATPQAAREGMTVYFSDPAAPGAEARSGGLDEVLIAAIDDARQSIDLAMYNISLQKVADALLRAAQRGVRVRMVIESEALDGRVPQRLKDSGLIEIIGDRREGLMHNKYMVIDERTVWTGSLNYTVSGTYDDNNNLVRIQSAPLAEDYRADFEAMFNDDLFGYEKNERIPHPQVTIDGQAMRVYFSPGGGAGEALVELVQRAQRSVHFLAYNLTRDDLTAALLEADRRGVEVRGVFDAKMAAESSGHDYEKLRKARLVVRLDGGKGLMHHKVIIVDRRWVVFGSYNFTASAEKKNNENLLIVDSPRLAESFYEEFEKLYNLAKK